MKGRLLLPRLRLRLLPLLLLLEVLVWKVVLRMSLVAQPPNGVGGGLGFFTGCRSAAAHVRSST